MNDHSEIGDPQADTKLGYFKANLAVKYGKPQAFKDPTGKPLIAAGYYRKFVVVAVSEDQARAMLSHEANDGEIDWQDSELEGLDFIELSEYSISPEDALCTPSVVFRSSHFLFP